MRAEGAVLVLHFSSGPVAQFASERIATAPPPAPAAVTRTSWASVRLNVKTESGPEPPPHASV